MEPSQRGGARPKTRSKSATRSKRAKKDKIVVGTGSKYEKETSHVPPTPRSRYQSEESERMSVNPFSMLVTDISSPEQNIAVPRVDEIQTPERHEVGPTSTLVYDPPTNSTVVQDVESYSREHPEQVDATIVPGRGYLDTVSDTAQERKSSANETALNPFSSIAWGSFPDSHDHTKNLPSDVSSDTRMSNGYDQSNAQMESAAEKTISQLNSKKKTKKCIPVEIPEPTQRHIAQRKSEGGSEWSLPKQSQQFKPVPTTHTAQRPVASNRNTQQAEPEWQIPPAKGDWNTATGRKRSTKQTTRPGLGPPAHPPLTGGPLWQSGPS